MKAILLGGAAASLLAAPALAQTAAQPAAAPAQPAAAAPAAAPAPAPSESAMVNLVRALIAQGTLTQERGDALIAQAEAEAAQARAAAAQTAVQASRVAANTQRVPYVPENVRQQIKDELRTEVLATAQAQGWAKPGAVPEWPQRIKISGDFRFRSQYNFYSRSNATNIIDFASFNRLGPIDINPSTNPQPGNALFPRTPLLNTTQDELHRLSIRARLALDAKITDTIHTGIRIATGGDDSPVSTTQFLGGGFDKKDIWLDRAFVEWEPSEQASFTFGRMPNPFYGVPGPQAGDRNTQIVWDEDLNFDGVAAELNTGDMLGEKLTIGLAGGAFAFEYGQDNFPVVSQTKLKEQNKWLLGGEITANWKPREDIGLTFVAAYYDFTGVQGSPSAPCQLYSGEVQCSTDRQVPFFLQRGNTLFYLRNIVPAPGVTDPSLPQFAALSYDYNILNLSADFRIRLNENLMLTVGGDYVKNLGFRRGDACKLFAGVNGGAATRRGPANNTQDAAATSAGQIAYGDICTPEAGTGRLARFIGGDTGYEGRVTIGYPKVKKLGDWSIYAAYRYLQSDATLDSLNDSDFHLGGTNAKGYIIAAQLGLFDNVSVRGRWFSTDAVSGPNYKIDTLQMDLLVGF